MKNVTLYKGDWGLSLDRSVRVDILIIFILLTTFINTSEIMHTTFNSKYRFGYIIYGCVVVLVGI